MDNRRLLLAVVLSWIVVIAWNHYFGPKPPPPGTRPAVEEMAPGESSASNRETSKAEAHGVGVANGLVEKGPGSVDEASEEREDVPETIVQATEESLVVVENERFLASFSNRGAQLVSFRLKDHLDGEGEPVEMVRARTGVQFPFSLVGGGHEGLALNDALFAAREQTANGGGEELHFEYSGPLGQATKSFFFSGSGVFRFEVEVEDERDWSVFLGPGASNPTAEQLKQPQFWRGGVYSAGGDREKVDARKAKEDERISTRGLSWAALDDLYFLAAVMPGEGAEEVIFRPFLVAGPDSEAAELEVLPQAEDLTAEQKDQPRAIGLLVRSRGDRIEGESYWGAKVYKELAALPLGLEQTVDFGWFSFLARPLQVALNWTYQNVVPNYGWAIVLMTLLIKLLMLPLTHHSMVSSQKMQELNPKVQAIRSRFRSKLKDRQGKPNMDAQRKMQDEIMGVYKSEGVNPASGCIPVVFQIPVFFAFYRLLGAAIELRHAPWIGWIQDLSTLDPFYVLPIVMFITQFIQQLRMPMGADPMQRRLFLMMPFIFLFVFLKFPSGLVLYWLTNNVFGIFQQEAYKVWKRKRAEAAQELKDAGSSKRKSIKA
ncbi:MAG: membrane protein insertase YidC [Deltaproteobacteria bacterium]|nr:membrane protein insertase YidC [Deltaproteobacteria bacterium]